MENFIGSLWKVCDKHFVSFLYTSKEMSVLDPLTNPYKINGNIIVILNCEEYINAKTGIYVPVERVSFLWSGQIFYMNCQSFCDFISDEMIEKVL